MGTTESSEKQIMSSSDEETKELQQLPRDAEDGTTTSTAATATVDRSPRTFRRRRLTVPTHRLREAASAAATAEDQHLDTDAEVVRDDGGVVESVTSRVASQPEHPLEQQLQQEQAHEHHEVDITDETSSSVFDERETSKTFRKRRLTLTMHNPHMPTEADFVVALNDTVDEEGGEEGRDVKRRRMSDVSHASTASASTVGSMSRSRIYHAGEIIRHNHPPINNNTNTHRLYTGPRNLEQYRPEEKQPIWKRRMTRSYSGERKKKLPFPSDVVGLYSCHGVEPLYEIDYDPTDQGGHNGDDDDDDDDDDWLNELPFENGTNALKRQPKVTTSAKINQDRGGVAYPYGDSPRTALFAVYDGHGQGGELVSQYCLHHVQQKLKRHPNFVDNLEKAFQETFLSVDRELITEPLIEPLYAGTTACVALLQDNRLTLSNTGDSRAVLARRRTRHNKDTSTTTATTTPTTEWETIQLTEDQNPDNPAEKARIESCGGFVSPPPEPGLSARVWLDQSCTQIGLAMSRSIGDHVVKPAGVVAEPVVTTHTVTSDDDFLILASDGVWEFITSEEAVQIVSSHLSGGASKACQALIEAAANKWHQEEGDYRDDITALVIRLQKLWNQVKS